MPEPELVPERGLPEPGLPVPAPVQVPVLGSRPVLEPGPQLLEQRGPEQQEPGLREPGPDQPAGPTCRRLPV